MKIKVTYAREYGDPITCNVDDIVCTHCGYLLAEEGKEEETKCHGSYFCGGIGENGGHDEGMRAWLYAYAQNNKHTKYKPKQ